MRGPRTAMKSGPRSLQLEKALAQKRRPNTAKNKLKKKIQIDHFLSTTFSPGHALIQMLLPSLFFHPMGLSHFLPSLLPPYLAALYSLNFFNIQLRSYEFYSD